MFFPDSGPVKETPPKKKRKKKPKQKKPKRVKLTLPARDIPTIGEADRQGNTPKRDGSLPAIPSDTVIAVEPFNTAEYLKLQADIYRQERLRETIAEDDELLLLLTKGET